MPSAERPLSPREHFHEFAALLARGVLRLRTYPSNASQKPPEFSEIRLDVRRDISPHVADA